MEQKASKTFVDFQITAFESVALDTRFFSERILVIGCEYVKKMCQDLKYY